MWVNWAKALLSLWVGVVHGLLISLIGWVKHKLVYTSVCILRLLMLGWGVKVSCWSCLPELSGTSWVEWCMTVSFLSLWVVVHCVSLLSLSGCPSCQLRGYSVKVKFHFEFVQYLGTELVLSQSMSLIVYQWDQTVLDSELSFSLSHSPSCHFRVVGWC